MDTTNISILSLISELITDKEQVKILQLISEETYGEDLLLKILENKEE